MRVFCLRAHQSGLGRMPFSNWRSTAPGRSCPHVRWFVSTCQQPWVSGCRGFFPRNPPVRIASSLRTRVPVTPMLFIHRVRELPSR